MSKKVMENVYLYDKKQYVAPSDYNDPLFRDINREMQSRTLDEQVDLMMDLAMLQAALPSQDHNQIVINDYLSNFFVPLDAENNLRKDEFEARMEKLEERRMARVYKPEGEFSFAQHGNHSHEWIAQNIAASETGFMDLAIFNSLFRMYDQSEAIEKAYNDPTVTSSDPDFIDAGEVLQDLSSKAQDKIFASMSEEDRKASHEGLNYIRTLNNHKYTPEEKEAERALKEKDLASGVVLNLDDNDDAKRRFEQAGAHALYNCCQKVDLSFVGNATLSVIQNSCKDVVMNGFVNQVTELDAQLFNKNVNGTRLFDSTEFNTIKDDLKKLQQDLKKGNDTKNLKDLMYSMKDFSEHCQKYLDKNPGKRRERGNERKRIVGEIKAALDKQIKWLDESFGEKFHENDHEWVDVKKVEKNGKVGIKLSYKDLSGLKDEPVKRASRSADPNPVKENAKNGPAI